MAEISILKVRKKLIARLRKRKPNFRRYNWFKYSLPDSWRKPRGLHSKMREDEKNKPATVKIGYRSAKIIRGLHPSGYEEVYVRTMNELNKVDKETQAARFASGLSEKKRKIMITKAKEIGVKILNP